MNFYNCCITLLIIKIIINKRKSILFDSFKIYKINLYKELLIEIDRVLALQWNTIKLR